MVFGRQGREAKAALIDSRSLTRTVARRATEGPDWGRFRTSQALPCQQYAEDCQYWGCDPACRFAVYSLPQSCQNPYNAELRCGSGIEVDGLDVTRAQLDALKPDVGTCLEMVEVRLCTASSSATVRLTLPRLWTVEHR